MIQIKQNNYVQPTEVREEVVQAICDAFLYGKCDSVFHPYDGSNKGCRNATLYVAKPTRVGVQKKWGFKCSRLVDSTDVAYRIRGAEMKRAFDELIKAGYYMLRIHVYGSWMGYECCEKPYDNFYRDADCVTSFNDNID